MSPWRWALGAVSPGERLGAPSSPCGSALPAGPLSVGAGRCTQATGRVCPLAQGRLWREPSRGTHCPGGTGRGGGKSLGVGFLPAHHLGRQPRTPLLPESCLRSSPHTGWLRLLTRHPQFWARGSAEARDGGPAGLLLWGAGGVRLSCGPTGLTWHRPASASLSQGLVPLDLGLTLTCHSLVLS